MNWLRLVLLSSFCMISECIEYQILGLIPLSGPEATKGWAQWQGMKLGIEETLHTVNDISGVKATFTINDTACDPVEENRLILDAYWNLSSERHLVVIGGGCSSVGQQVSLGTLQHSIPQLTFEEKPIRVQHPPILSPLSVRISTYTDVYAELVHFVQTHNWKQIVIVYNKENEDVVQAVDEFQQSDIEVSLRVHSSTLYEKYNVLRNSRLRIILLLVDYEEAFDIICLHYQFDPDEFRRYIWLLVVTNVTDVVKTLKVNCTAEINLDQVVLFQRETIFVSKKVSQVFSHVVANDLTLTSDPDLEIEAAYSYDATRILLDSLRSLGEAPVKDNVELSWKFSSEVRSRRWVGVTGSIEIDENGRRRVHSEVYTFEKDIVEGQKLIKLEMESERSTVVLEENMGADTVGSNTILEGVPLSLFVIMCALAAIGIAYAIAIIAFNIVKRRHRAIKMTSPNINVVIMLGCCGMYACMVMFGLDTTRVSRATMETLLQATTYMITLGFSVIYGLISAKSWRVFMIFKNLSTNGKLTRDEHLLLGLIFMIILDLCVLIPWHMVDPITCSRKAISEVFEHSNMTDVTTEIDVCHSNYQDVWIAVLYVYKLIILGLGFFFSWQTRHVTLPALRDNRMVYVTICLVITMALVALPVLLVPSTGVVMTYAVGGLVLWLTSTLTITLLFMTKVFLYRKEAKRISHGESFRFQFSESMKRTQEAIRKLAGCLCCGTTEEDKYGQEMLLTEIDCLKGTIREKDATIRELNDRLYVGAQKFHDYLKHPNRHETALDFTEKTQMTLQKSNPPSGRALSNNAIIMNKPQRNTYERNTNSNVRVLDHDADRVVIKSGSRREVIEEKRARHNYEEITDYGQRRSGSVRDLREGNNMQYRSTNDISSHIAHHQETMPQRAYPYSSLPRNQEDLDRIALKYHQRGRRPSTRSTHSYHDNDAISTRDMPIYTIDVHSDRNTARAPVDVHRDQHTTRVPVDVHRDQHTTRAQRDMHNVQHTTRAQIDMPTDQQSVIRGSVEVHRTPVMSGTRKQNGVYNSPEKHSPTSSTNFDSAIDNNSPSSTSSNDSFQDDNWKHRNSGMTQTKNTIIEPIRDDIRSHDIQNGDIDLEAIEKEAANSHRYEEMQQNSPRYHEYSQRHPGYHTGNYHTPQIRKLEFEEYQEHNFHGHHKRQSQI